MAALHLPAVKGGRRDADRKAMWLDGLVIVLIACLAWAGARRGAAIAGVQLLGQPLACAAAAGGALWWGPMLARQLGTSGTLGALAAGTAAYVLMLLSLALLKRVIRGGDDEPEAGSRALGALFGALRGALYALPVLWLAGLSEGARVAGVWPGLPDLSGAQLPAVGNALLGGGAHVLLDEAAPGDRMTMQLVRQPGETVEAFQKLVADPRFASLQRDTGFWGDVERGAVNAALARPDARALVDDRAFRARLGALGVVSPAAVANPHSFESELSLALAELGPRLAAVRDDPAFAELLADPAVRASVQSGNSLALLRDARFRGLVSKATSAR